MYRRGASQRGSSRLCLFPVTVAVVQQSVRSWAAAAWTSGSGAVGCNGAESGGGTDSRSAGGGVKLIGRRDDPGRSWSLGGSSAEAANPLWAAVR